MGHSGEEADIPLDVTFTRAPANEKVPASRNSDICCFTNPPVDFEERLDVLKTMIAHSQF